MTAKFTFVLYIELHTCSCKILFLTIGYYNCKFFIYQSTAPKPDTHRELKTRMIYSNLLTQHTLTCNIFKRVERLKMPSRRKVPCVCEFMQRGFPWQACGVYGTVSSGSPSLQTCYREVQLADLQITILTDVVKFQSGKNLKTCSTKWWRKSFHLKCNLFLHKNEPLAANGHMVQNPPCWRVSAHWNIQNKATSSSYTWIFFVLDVPCSLA